MRSSVKKLGRIRRVRLTLHQFPRQIGQTESQCAKFSREYVLASCRPPGSFGARLVVEVVPTAVCVSVARCARTRLPKAPHERAAQDDGPDGRPPTGVAPEEFPDALHETQLVAYAVPNDGTLARQAWQRANEYRHG